MPRRKGESPKEAQEPKPKKRSGSKGFDVKELYEEYFQEVVDALGLSRLSLDKEELKEVLEEPFISAVGDVKTKPKSKTIISRLSSRKEDLFEMISVKLLKDKEELTQEQLEFAVYNLSRAIKEFAPFLYAKCAQAKREDLIETLRLKWKEYGLKSPVSCPYCSFASVMPDLSCAICGKLIPESKVKQSLNLVERLTEMKTTDPDSFNEIVKKGYLYVSTFGIIPPGRRDEVRDQLLLEIFLTKKEIQNLTSP